MSLGVGLSVLVAVLAGCTKPTPGVTLQSGSRSVRAEATAYVRDGHEVRSGGAITVLRTFPGSDVGVDVDRSIADRGWSVHIVTRGTDSSTFDSANLKGSHHYSFVVGGAPTDVVISQLNADNSPSGLWTFTIAPTLQ